eukprot:SAG11_NODE_4949_length_1712_cov_0.789213_2_plen_91_part_00
MPQVVLPLLASVAAEADLPPPLLMVPATCSTSLAFMLPVATPPNAIVIAGGAPVGLRVADMALPGLALNCLAVISTVSFTLLWAPTTFGF